MCSNRETFIKTIGSHSYGGSEVLHSDVCKLWSKESWCVKPKGLRHRYVLQSKGSGPGALIHEERRR